MLSDKPQWDDANRFTRLAQTGRKIRARGPEHENRVLDRWRRLHALRMRRIHQREWRRLRKTSAVYAGLGLAVVLWALCERGCL